MSNILERLTVARTYLELKFKMTLQVSSLINEHFVLDRITATDPEELASVSNPFKDIILSDHYNSLSRTLVLFFSDYSESVMPVGDYRLTIDGVKNSSGLLMPAETFDYEYTFETPDTDAPVPSDEPVHVKDFSVKNAFITSETIFAANPDFYIADTDPENNTIFLEEDYNKGRVTVRFSERPSLAFMSDEFIKVQKKEIEPIVSRWEKIDAKFKLGASPSKNLYIRFPSVPEDEEDEVVYAVDGKMYFEPGYKYRIRFSSEISSG